MNSVWMRWLSFALGAAFFVLIVLILLPFLLILILLSLIFGSRVPLFQTFRFQRGRPFPFGTPGRHPFSGAGRGGADPDAQDIECEVVSSSTESVDPPNRSIDSK